MTTAQINYNQLLQSLTGKLPRKNFTRKNLENYITKWGKKNNTTINTEDANKIFNILIDLKIIKQQNSNSIANCWGIQHSYQFVKNHTKTTTTTT